MGLRATTLSVLPVFSRLHESVITLALDFLSDSRNTISLLSEEIDVVDQQVRLGDATSLRITQFWLFLAVRSPLPANDVFKTGFALIAFQLQVIDQPAYLRAWFIDPWCRTTSAHERAPDHQCRGENLQSLNHVCLRPSRNRACNIARRPQRFHRIGRSKRTGAFLHPYSVGTGVSVVMLDRLFKRGAVCASA
jgi:hypothetical protein